VTAPFVTLTSHFGEAVPFLVFAVPAGLAAGLSGGLPETRGKPLPQQLSDIVPEDGPTIAARVQTDIKMRDMSPTPSNKWGNRKSA
jgi:hypothetical protein